MLPTEMLCLAACGAKITGRRATCMARNASMSAKLTPRLPMLTLCVALAACASASVAPTPAPARSSTAEPTTSSLPPLARACEGDHLDLAWLAAAEACVAPYDQPVLAPPELLRARLEPAQLVLSPGAVVEVDYVLQNPGDTAQTFDLSALRCTTDDFELWIVDHQGEQVDRMPHHCKSWGSCSTSDARLTLAPGGDARIRLELRAESRVTDEDCEVGDAIPLPPGHYVVWAGPNPNRDMPFALNGARAELEIVEANSQ